MNIAIVRHSIGNRGSDNAFFNYADYLIKHNHQIFYYTNTIETELPYNPAIQFRPIPVRGKAGTILFTLLKKFPEDLVAVDLIVLAPIAWLRNKRKLVYLARGYDVSYFSLGAMRWFIKLLYRFALRFLKIPVITASYSLSATLRQFSSHKILTAPNGVNTDFFQRQPNQKTFLRNSNEQVILFYYRHEYVKGADVALRAFERLAELKKKGWVVWVIGEELSDQTRFKIVNHGFLSHEKLRDILSATDIFILSSRSEGLSPLLLQALSCGCAVVATEASSILTHEENGLVTPIEDWETIARHLQRLFDDESLKIKLQRNARLLADQYSLEKSCQRFEGALLSVKQEHS